MDCLRIDQPHHPRTLKLAHLTAWGAATWLRNPISGRACYARYATVLEPKLPAQRSVVPCGQGHHASASLPARHGTLAYAPPKRNPCPPGGHALAHTTPCGCWCEAARAHRRRTERGSVRTVLDGLTVTHGGCSVTSGVYTGVCAVGGSVVRPMGSRDAASDASESGGEAEPVAHPDAWVQCDKCTKWRRIPYSESEKIGDGDWCARLPIACRPHRWPSRADAHTIRTASPSSSRPCARPLPPSASGVGPTRYVHAVRAVRAQVLRDERRRAVQHVQVAAGAVGRRDRQAALRPTGAQRPSSLWVYPVRTGAT
jgi:hypothetical protein